MQTFVPNALVAIFAAESLKKRVICTEVITIKEFNDTGLCVPHLCYMADRSVKIKELVALVEKSKYFTINLPRRYGKNYNLSSNGKRT